MNEQSVKSSKAARWWKLPADVAARRDIKAGPKVIYAVMMTRVGDNGCCWPGLLRLAKDCGVYDHKTVESNVGKLVAAGLLTVDRGDSVKSNRYHLVKGGEETAPVPEAGGTVKTTVPSGGGTVKITVGGYGRNDRLKDKNGKDKSKTDVRRQKPPPDPRVKMFIDWFSDAYLKSKGFSYSVTHGKDESLVQGMLKAMDADATIQDPVAELQLAAKAMLRDDWGGPRASISILKSGLSQWRGKGHPAKSSIPTYAEVCKQLEG